MDYKWIVIEPDHPDRVSRETRAIGIKGRARSFTILLFRVTKERKECVAYFILLVINNQLYERGTSLILDSSLELAEVYNQLDSLSSELLSADIKQQIASTMNHLVKLGESSAAKLVLYDFVKSRKRIAEIEEQLRGARFRDLIQEQLRAHRAVMNVSANRI